MIDVEIRGPVAKKEYDRVKKLFSTAGESVFVEHQVVVSYTDRGFNNRAVRLEYKNGVGTICIETGKIGERKEIKTRLAHDSFSDAVQMLAELGYKKANVEAREVFSCVYGGAFFSLYDPDGESYYYDAVISAVGPDDTKEAKEKLHKLGRKFMLPMWSPIDMLEFNRKLKEKTNWLYDYETDGVEYFKDKFGI